MSYHEAVATAAPRGGIWPTFIRATRSWFWLLCVDVYPALVAVCLPWSTTAVAVFWFIWLIVLIPVIDYRSFARSLREPACWLPLAFFGLALVGTLWAEGPWRDRFAGVSPVLKFLILPFLLYHFSRSKRSHLVLWAFVISCALLLVSSWVVIFEPQWKLTHVDVPGVPIKNSIDQSHEFALSMFLLAPIALGLFNGGRLVAFTLLAALIVAFYASLVFVATSRTSLVYIPILIVLFSWRFHFSAKATAILLSAAAMIAAVTWFTSPYLRVRVEAVRGEYLNYRDANLPTSTGMRLEWWRRSLDFIADAPIFGNGTGSTKRLLNKDASAKNGLWSATIRNPHNQTLNVAIEWGLFGCLTLYGMWFCHLMLFREFGLASWIGFAVVIQNIFSSIFNSHLFDFTEGWIYVLGVGTAGGVVLNSKLRGTFCDSAPSLPNDTLTKPDRSASCPPHPDVADEPDQSEKH